MDGTTEPAPEPAPVSRLSVPSGKGFLSCQIEREQGAAWVTCEWYEPSRQGYERRLAVTDGQDLQPWILERFGSGKYKLAYYKANGMSHGKSAHQELVSAEHPQRPHRIGAPPAPLPGPMAQPAAAAPPTNGAAAPWAPPQQPSWVQWQEMARDERERERRDSAERMAAIRADEDDRRERREREETERRRRDIEDSTLRAANDRARALAELDALRERHKLDMERARFDHELRLKQLEQERDRDRGPSADDFADALEQAKEDLRVELATKPPEKPSEFAQALSFVQPHLPAIMGALQEWARANARRAAAAAIAPPGPTEPAG